MAERRGFEPSVPARGTRSPPARQPPGFTPRWPRATTPTFRFERSGVSTSKIRPNGNFVPLVFFRRFIFHSSENTGRSANGGRTWDQGETSRYDYVDATGE